MDNAALVKMILDGDATFTYSSIVDFKNVMIGGWRLAAYEWRRDLYGINAQDWHVAARACTTDNCVQGFEDIRGSKRLKYVTMPDMVEAMRVADQELAKYILAAIERQATVEHTDKDYIKDVRPIKWYRTHRILWAAQYTHKLDIGMIRPKAVRHMLFAHPTGKIVRLSETPGVCETADGEALAAETMRPAHNRFDHIGLSQWWPIAFDFGMILPSFQRQP